MTGVRCAAVIARREAVRLGRQPARIAAAVLTPIMVWAFLAGGFAGAVGLTGTVDASGGAAGFDLYLVPGICSMVVVFACVFGAISVIEDGQTGVLRSVLASPAPAWSVLMGKAGALSLLGLAQAAVVLPLAFVAGTGAGVVGVVQALVILALLAVGTACVSVALAWRCASVQGFHSIMNTVLMPMWLLSGAVFPLADAATWLRWIALANPLTWPTAAMQQALLTPVGPTPLAWAGAVAYAGIGSASLALIGNKPPAAVGGT